MEPTGDSLLNQFIVLRISQLALTTSGVKVATVFSRFYFGHLLCFMNQNVCLIRRFSRKVTRSSREAVAESVADPMAIADAWLSRLIWAVPATILVSSLNFGNLPIHLQAISVSLGRLKSFRVSRIPYATVPRPNSSRNMPVKRIRGSQPGRTTHQITNTPGIASAATHACLTSPSQATTRAIQLPNRLNQAIICFADTSLIRQGAPNYDYAA